jgi:hypothetical protein
MEKPADLSPDRSDRISKYLQKLPRQLLQVFFLTPCLFFCSVPPLSLLCTSPALSKRFAVTKRSGLLAAPGRF